MGGRKGGQSGKKVRQSTVNRGKGKAPLKAVAERGTWAHRRLKRKKRKLCTQN